MWDSPNDNSFNLERANILIADGDSMGTSISAQVLAGFGAKNIQKVSTVEEAMRALEAMNIDLLVLDPATTSPNGYDLAPWVRRRLKPPNRYMPILVTTGHTQASRVGSLRDAGANYVVSKPFSPAALIARLIWLSREKRPYVDCEVYAGPDRRWKYDGPPPGSEGRRSDDVSPELGDASQPNMSQAQIDAMMQPRKISL